jgi:hypothetical protein
MVESHDKLIMEFADKYGYNCSDEGADDEDEDEDDNDRGDAAAPPAAAPPPTPAPPNVAPEEIIKEKAPMEMVPEQEASEAHEVILAHAEIELPQPRLFNMIMRDCEEIPSRMMDGLHELDDLDDPTDADYDVDEWFPVDGSNDWD